MEDWKQKLANLYEKKLAEINQENARQKQNDESALQYITLVVLPAFEELKAELEKHGREVTIHNRRESAVLEIIFGQNHEFGYEIQIRGAEGIRKIINAVNRTDRKRYSNEGGIGTSSNDNRITTVTKEQIIEDFLKEYSTHI
jgi:hypothetical protein